MAVSDNLGLYLPDREDYISVQRDLKSNYEIIDEHAGMVEDGIAIVINGDTAPRAITSGQYLMIKNHSTLATGGYHATANIANGASVTSSNVAVDSDGIANALNGNKVNTSAIKNNLTTSKSGYVLDARQGKALNDKIAPSGGTHAGFFVYNGKYHSGLFIPYPRADVITASCSTFDLVGITTGVSVDSIEKFKNGFLLQHTFADTTTPNGYNGKSGQATLSFS